MPSDDEDEDEEIDEEDDDEEEDDRITRKQVFITPKPVRKSCPLPSDDEDSEDGTKKYSHEFYYFLTLSLRKGSRGARRRCAFCISKPSL